jgi:SAM-dependent methyltransferase
MSNRVTSGFNPNLFHPFYFVRKGLYKAIKKNAAELAGVMMDFGCGSKPYKSLFNVKEYIGVDYNGDGHSHEKEEIDVFYDGKTIPFPDNHFDAVFSSEVFEHLFNLEEILPELNRVMKPDSKILITCPFVWNEHEVPNDYARYTQFALKHLLEKHGFSIIKIEKTGTFVTTIFQMIVVYNLQYILPVFGFLMKISPIRFILKFLFILLPNLAGVVSNTLLPRNQGFYQNTIVLAKKN